LWRRPSYSLCACLYTSLWAHLVLAGLSAHASSVTPRCAAYVLPATPTTLRPTFSCWAYGAGCRCDLVAFFSVCACFALLFTAAPCCRSLQCERVLELNATHPRCSCLPVSAYRVADRASTAILSNAFLFVGGSCADLDEGRCILYTTAQPCTACPNTCLHFPALHALRGRRRYQLYLVSLLPNHIHRGVDVLYSRPCLRIVNC